ncbi:hypothetical protein Tco_0260978 [Tanacetum coccineum]
MPKESPQRSTPGTENLTTTTVTNAQLQAMIDQGVTAALVARDATEMATTAILLERVSEGMNTKKQLHSSSQVKFANCTLQEKCIAVVELSRKTTLQNYPDNTWKTLKKMMTDKYCPRGEIKRLMLKCGIRTGEGYRMW